jgi:hypothetical protein
MNKLNLFPIKLPNITWELVFVIGLGVVVVINTVSTGIMHGWW